MEAQVFNFKGWIRETNPDTLKKTIGALLKEAGFEVVKTASHKSEPQGYTAVWVISESHLAIHTWPEHNATYLELSSCNLEKQELFLDLMMEKLDLMFNQPARIIGALAEEPQELTELLDLQDE